MVQRFGAPPGTYWGVFRVKDELTWDRERVFAIPAAEYARFRAEYDGAVSDGGLIVRLKAEFEAQEKKRVEARKVAKKEIV